MAYFLRTTDKDGLARLRAERQGTHLTLEAKT